MEQPRQKRWWYRLVQVLFSLLIVSVVTGWLVMLFFFVQLRFITDEYRSSYQVRCSDGSLRGDFTSAKLDYSKTDINERLGKEYMRFVCSHTSLSMEEATSSYIKLVPPFPTGGYTSVKDRESRDSRLLSEFGVPKEKNYSVEILRKEYQGSWWSVLFVLVGGLILIPLASILARALFLYIAFGESFRKSLWFWQKRNLNS